MGAAADSEDVVVTAGRATPSAGRDGDVLRVWHLSDSSAGEGGHLHPHPSRVIIQNPHALGWPHGHAGPPIWRVCPAAEGHDGSSYP